MSQIDIRDIVTKSDLVTLNDIQNSGLAEYGDSHESMILEWQKRLDKKISSLQYESKLKISDFTEKWLFSPSGVLLLFLP